MLHLFPLISRLSAALPVFFLVVGAARPVPAAEIDRINAYQACMAKAEVEPRDAFKDALAWQGLGGGDAAEHCAAKALLFMGQYGEAAQRFEDLAQRIKADAATKAALLGQSAQGWMLANLPERADDVLTAALGLLADDAGLRVDRGLARAQMRRYGPAVEDFSRAIEIEPRRAEAYAFRAAAYRYLDKLDLASADVEMALRIEPENPEALLERGFIRRLSGDDTGARADWLLVIEAAPNTAAARTAQENLQLMDSGAEKPE